MTILMLPDLLVYLTIFICGFLAGLVSIALVILLYCMNGGIIRIQCTSDDFNIKQEDF